LKNVFYSSRSKIAQMQGAVVCRFIGAFKDAHKWASYRYVQRSDEGNATGFVVSSAERWVVFSV